MDTGMGVEATKVRKKIAERHRLGMDSATPERIAKTDEPFYAKQMIDAETGETIEVQELSDWPLERLYKAGAFGNKSEAGVALAAARYDAGQRLYAHWYYGRLFSLGSRDYRKPYTGSSDAFPIMPQTERQAFHRIRWREADNCLGSDRVARVTKAIVIDEKEPVAVGRAVTERQHEGQARAVAIEFLIEGLDRLRALWRIEARTEEGRRA